MIGKVIERIHIVGDKLSGKSRIRWAEVAVRMAPEVFHERVREALGSDLRNWSQTLRFPENGSASARHSVFHGPMPNVDQFDCFYSVVAPGMTTDHGKTVEEELVFPIDGDIEIVRGHGMERIGPGQFAFHGSGDRVMIRGAGPGKSSFVVLRWSARPYQRPPALTSKVVDYRDALATARTRDLPLAVTPQLDGATEYLEKLHVQFTTLQPGNGWPPHTDTYDAVILLLRGSLDALGQVLHAPTVVSHSGFQIHGFRAIGDARVEMLAVEFWR